VHCRETEPRVASPRSHKKRCEALDYTKPPQKSQIHPHGISCGTCSALPNACDLPRKRPSCKTRVSGIPGRHTWFAKRSMQSRRWRWDLSQEKRPRTMFRHHPAQWRHQLPEGSTASRSLKVTSQPPQAAWEQRSAWRDHWQPFHSRISQAQAAQWQGFAMAELVMEVQPAQPLSPEGLGARCFRPAVLPL
jgi:hypothetical protein